MQETSVRMRRAIAADRSANDIAQQVTMTRETDKTAEQGVVNNLPVEREPPPQTNHHEVAEW